LAEVKVSESGDGGARKSSILALFLKGGLGVTFVGALGTLIGAFFQNLSAYEDKAAAQAKDDLAAAAQTFTEASSALSVPLSLQERLVFGYYDAVDQNVDGDDNALVTKNARAIDAPYEAAYTSLRENINLLAQKAEIYLDWPSNPKHDPTKSVPPTQDPISSSALGTYKFDCDNNMPVFTGSNTTTKLPSPSGDGSQLIVDWYSAKHNILAIYYCFNIINSTMKPLREWAAHIPPAPAARSSFLGRKSALEAQLTKQVLRQYAFMGLAMNEIEQIRVRYRPNGYQCSVPILRGLLGQRCTAFRDSSL
jgi:hypothetical protein